MRDSFKTGLSFGLTSGIITTLGLIVGLNAGTHSKISVIGGILTIAVADAFSDALGIHISQETQKGRCDRSVWESTVATFFAKIVFALSFVVPVLAFELTQAILASLIWGLVILVIFSYAMGKQEKGNPWKVVVEHVVIAVLVITASHFLGNWISLAFTESRA